MEIDRSASQEEANRMALAYKRRGMGRFPSETNLWQNFRDASVAHLGEWGLFKLFSAYGKNLCVKNSQLNGICEEEATRKTI